MARNIPPIHLVIRQRQHIVFENDVTAVSSVNQKGPFDILALHADFISIIEKYVTIHHLNGQKERIPIEKALMHVEDEHVNIYLQF